jgi:hypothetical protein
MWRREREREKGVGGNNIGWRGCVFAGRANTYACEEGVGLGGCAFRSLFMGAKCGGGFLGFGELMETREGGRLDFNANRKAGFALQQQIRELLTHIFFRSCNQLQAWAWGGDKLLFSTTEDFC